jgi:putative membrane protein
MSATRYGDMFFPSVRSKPAPAQLVGPIILIAAMAGGLFAVFSYTADGSLTRHMALHILLMNAVAPTAAVLITKSAARRKAGSPRWVVVTTCLQIAALWSWHAPPVLEAAMRMSLVHLAMQISLFGAALLFWSAIIGEQGAARWRSILALLITSKLYCLLGALLLFAPEALYSSLSASHLHETAGSGIADQRSAGLLMLAVCPPAYVATGIFMAARWLRDLAGSSDLAPAEAGSYSLQDRR